MSPSKARYSMGWSSVCTARWSTRGSGGMPLGTAHDASTPLRSSRRSQCSEVAWCSWTTKRASFAVASPGSPAGSGVREKSRFSRYVRSSPTSSTVGVHPLRRDAEDDPLGCDGGLVVGAAEVLLAERVDVLAGVVAPHCLHHPPAHLGVAVGVVPVHYGDRHAGVVLCVAVLGPVGFGVDQHVVVVAVHPHDVRHGGAVAQQGGEGGEVGALGQGAHGVVDHGRTLPTSRCQGSGTDGTVIGGTVTVGTVTGSVVGGNVTVTGGTVT